MTWGLRARFGTFPTRREALAVPQTSRVNDWLLQYYSTKAHLDVREDASVLEGLSGFEWAQALSHRDDPTKPSKEQPFIVCTEVRNPDAEGREMPSSICPRLTGRRLSAPLRGPMKVPTSTSRIGNCA
jgi:hypothetical protein